MTTRGSFICNKKVLLCERKRHTAHHVAHACYTALSPGGTNHPVLTGGVTPSSPNEGISPSNPSVGWVYPHPVLMGYTIPVIAPDLGPNLDGEGSLGNPPPPHPDLGPNLD